MTIYLARINITFTINYFPEIVVLRLRKNIIMLELIAKKPI